jgi:TATA-binding protein-associated factor Taf7
VVHLTGYLMETSEMDYDDFDEDDDDDELDVEEESSDVEEEAAAKNKVNGVAKKLAPLDKLLAEAKKKSADKARILLSSFLSSEYSLDKVSPKKFRTNFFNKIIRKSV